MSDLIGRRVRYGIGIVASGASAFASSDLLTTRIPGLVPLGSIVSLLCHDMQYGPQGALIAESFATPVRYSGAGISYQVTSVIAGGPAPLIATTILAGTGSSTSLSCYLLGCAALSLIALASLPRRVTPAKPIQPAIIRANSPRVENPTMTIQPRRGLQH